MNHIQRAYESYDQSNYNLKITNSYYHFKNMQNIYRRKPQYNAIRKLNFPRLKIGTSPQSKLYLFQRDNEIYKKMLKEIISAKAKPKLNNYYKTREEKLRDYRNQSRTIENQKLIRVNDFVDNCEFKLNYQVYAGNIFLNLKQIFIYSSFD